MKLIAYRAYPADGAAGADDICRNSRPENGRAFINTDRLFA